MRGKEIAGGRFWRFVRRLFLLIPAGMSGVCVYARLSLTYESLLQRAWMHHRELRKARMEVLRARYQRLEAIGRYLPEIQVGAQYQYFLELPQTPVPARFFVPGAPEDAFLYITLGTKQRMDWEIQVRQVLFSGPILVGILASRVYLHLRQWEYHLTAQEVAVRLLHLYATVLYAMEARKYARALRESAERLYRITHRLAGEGLVDSLEVARTRWWWLWFQQQEENLEKQERALLEVLLAESGIPQDSVQDVHLADSLQGLIQRMTHWIQPLEQQPLDIRMVPRYRWMQVQASAQRLYIRSIQAEALPTIVGVGGWSRYAFAEESFPFFTEPDVWRTQAFVGIRVQVPLFTGGQRTARILQERMRLQQIQEELRHLPEILRSQRDYWLVRFQEAWRYTELYRKKARLLQLRFQKMLREMELGLRSPQEVEQVFQEWQVVRQQELQYARQVVEAVVELGKLLPLYQMVVPEKSDLSGPP